MRSTVLSNPLQGTGNAKMHFLNIVTIICSGLMVGSELAVSAFVNPALWQVDDEAQAKAVSLLARTLGKIMPFWYVLCMVLLAGEVYLHGHDPDLTPLLVALVIWTAVIICTVLFLVPINNRIASLQPPFFPALWKQDHKRWDTLHRWRILLLTVAMVSLTYALVRSS
ncbi:MAG TPA: DUF1772 domain-containing protein [Bryobacteraceae bacterium]|jgi:uncharacterized membrane protein|nr:DUF1772 domain-containing protein [Bryobacteraceae bacterium]